MWSKPSWTGFTKRRVRGWWVGGWGGSSTYLYHELKFIFLRLERHRKQLEIWDGRMSWAAAVKLG